MKRIIILPVLFFLLFITGGYAQSDAAMKVWKEYMTPGDVHKMIASADGEWTVKILMWMDPTATTPSETVSTTTNEMIMGGRYQLSKTKGTMMGMPFEGMSLLGYDNTKKVFTSTWVDNFGTGTMTLEGVWNDATKSIELKGKSFDPITSKDASIREIIKFTDNDHQEMQMFETKSGSEKKTMEIKMTRKK